MTAGEPMPISDSVRRYRPLLYAAAILFAALTIFYSAAWMYYIRQQEQVEIGIDNNLVRGALEIRNVYKDSPAERAGLKVGDRVLAVNGKPASIERNDSPARVNAWVEAKPGMRFG